MQLIGPPRRPEIDEYTIKFLIGAIALLLPLIELVLTEFSITSISASFWYDSGLWPRNIFVGCLFLIGGFMVAYNGHNEFEMWLAKAAAVSAFLIAMFPCPCGDPAREILPRVHLISAVVMFAVLTCFCAIFYRNARAKRHFKANLRAGIYSVTGAGMVVSLAMFLWYTISKVEPLIFWGETVGLVSFGLAWLTASRVIPLTTEPDEQHSLFVGSGTGLPKASAPAEASRSRSAAKSEGA